MITSFRGLSLCYYLLTLEVVGWEGPDPQVMTFSPNHLVWLDETILLYFQKMWASSTFLLGVINLLGIVLMHSGTELSYVGKRLTHTVGI